MGANQYLDTSTTKKAGIKNQWKLGYLYSQKVATGANQNWDISTTNKKYLLRIIKKILDKYLNLTKYINIANRVTFQVFNIMLKFYLIISFYFNCSILFIKT